MLNLVVGGSAGSDNNTSKALQQCYGKIHKQLHNFNDLQKLIGDAMWSTTAHRSP
jgi:hypothetical protein